MTDIDLWRGRMEKQIEELADVTMGSRRTELEGGGRHSDGLRHQMGRVDERLGLLTDRVDGLAESVADLTRKLGNGGIRIRLTAGQWAGLITLLTALVGFATAVLQGNPTP